MSSPALLSAVSDNVEGEFESEKGSSETGQLGELSVFPYQETEEVSKAVFEYLQASNEPNPDLPELQPDSFEWISNQEIELEHEIQTLKESLAEKESTSSTPQETRETPAKASSQNTTQTPRAKEQPATEKNPFSHFFKPATKPSTPQKPPEKTFSSLFALAKSIHKPSLNKNPTNATPKESPKQENKKTELRPQSARAEKSQESEQTHTPLNKQEREEKEGSHQQQQQDQQEKQQQQEQKQPQEKFIKKEKRTKVSAKVSTVKRVSGPKSQGRPWDLLTSTNTPSQETTVEETPEIGDIFYRFMALMARILGQAEAEAHALYKKIKGRTDNIDLLTLLIQKINSEKKDIDWSNNEEMKALIDKARALGVDIPKDKYKWNESEKTLLKENISMRKDGMEKLTQLERTDMQRYLQEASQCHQARSNLLKLLKEVIDTIIHNLRP